MATGTLILNLSCTNPKCKHTLLLEVCTTIAKGAHPVSLEPAMQSAAVVLGYARVHSPGTTPRVLCGSCRGRVRCRACRIERQPDPHGGDFLCASPSFDVDRVIEEGQGDDYDARTVECNEFLCLPERNPSHYHVDGRHYPKR